MAESATDLALPAPHARFLTAAVRKLAADPRLVGVAAGGSVRTGEVDEFSDLDLIVAVEPASFDAVLADAERIAAGLGPLLASFTGEHVGEPRLLICLYGPPPLHVDLKFVTLSDLARRVEDPVVLWQRGERLSTALGAGEAVYPAPELQWIEDRFWTWVHYTAAKVGRGELFEAIDALAFLRQRVLGPLALAELGERPAGVRRIESLAPAFAAELQRTLARHDRAECADALRAAAELYRRLRSRLAGSELVVRAGAEAAALQYLDEVTG